MVPADASAPTMLMQLWWNSIDSSAPEGTPLRPVATQVVAPEQVPRLEQPDRIALRVLAGSYRSSADVVTSNAHPVLIMHVRLDAGADGALTPLPSEFNGFAWLLEGAAHIGAASLLVQPGAHGLVRLPPGGDTLRLRNASSDERCGYGITRRVAVFTRNGRCGLRSFEVCSEAARCSHDDLDVLVHFEF